MGIEELKAGQQNALRREELQQRLAVLTAQFWEELPDVFRLIESDLSDLKLSLYVSDTGKYGRIDLPGLGRAVTILSPETIVRKVGKKRLTLHVLPPREAPFKTEVKVDSLAAPIIFHIDSALLRHHPTLSEDASGTYPFAGFYRFLWCGQAENHRLAASLARIIRGEKPKSDFEFEPLAALAQQGHYRCFIATEIYGPDAPETETLRCFRDQCLISSVLGRGLVEAYYRFSPSIVRVVQWSTGARSLLRHLLRVIVSLLRLTHRMQRRIIYKERSR